MFVRPVTSELQKVAEVELNEISDKTEESLQHIKDWLAKQPYLKVRNDDQWLINFLRMCRYSLQETKQALDFYHTFRTALPEYYVGRDPFHPEIQEFLNRGIYIWLPNASIDPAAPKILIFRLGYADNEQISLVTGIKVVLMIFDILIMEDDNFITAGHTVLIDMKDVDYRYLTQFTPSIIKKFLILFRCGYRLRSKQIHIINITPPIKSLFNIMVKCLMSDKMLKRITFYDDNNSDSIHKNIPLSILPKEYGGEGSTFQQLKAEVKSKVESYKDWFLEDEIYRSDESKRPGKPKTETDLFGVEGSFRKLTLD